MADVKVEDDGDLAKDQELVLSVSLAGQLDLTNKLSVAGSAIAEFYSLQDLTLTFSRKKSSKRRICLQIFQPLEFDEFFGDFGECQQS